MRKAREIAEKLVDKFPIVSNGILARGLVNAVEEAILEAREDGRQCSMEASEHYFKDAQNPNTLWQQWLSGR